MRVLCILLGLFWVSSLQATALVETAPLGKCEKLLLYILEKPVAYGWMLRKAAERGDEEKVDWLLGLQETQVDAAFRSKFTALHLAAANGHLNIVQKLIMAGADARALTWPDHYTPLHSAAEGGHANIVRYLLVERAVPVVADESGDTPLHTAVRAGHHDVVQVFSRRAESLNDRDEKGLTPLHWAVYLSDEELVRSLIQQGAKVNIPAYDSAHAAAQEVDKRGHVVRDPELPENHAFSYSPLHTAVEKGFANIAQMLLDAGADLQARTEAGSSVLHLAAVTNQLSMVKWALESGAAMEAQNNAGNTALAEAIKRRHKDVVDVLKSKI